MSITEAAMWDKIKWHLQRFMIGRNGRDEIGMLVLWISAVLCLISAVFRTPFLDILAWLGIIYVIYRICSKDVYKRREENQKFLQEIEFIKLRISVRKTHKIYRCKGCGRKIRVPRGKGKIEITCPLCGRKMIHRT
jgi:predicted RNA-binding Zn-ribbon protein involved in translation (DUF1610 family)